MNKTLSKDDVGQLINTIKFLNGLKLGDGDYVFKSYQKDDNKIVFVSKNGNEEKISIGEIKVKSDKTDNSTNNVANVTTNVTNAQSGGKFYSDSTLAGLTEIEEIKQSGGNVYTDSSSVVHKTFLKSKSKKHSKKDFSSTSSAMMGGFNNNFDSETSSVNPQMFNMLGGGDDKKSDMFSSTSSLKGGMIGGGNFSETSSINPQILGGNFSETSSLNPQMLGGNFSETSSLNPQMLGGNYSETSSFNPRMTGAPVSETSSLNPKMLGGKIPISDTSSDIVGGMIGGGSETLDSISELKSRKNADLNIFRKQNGGGVDQTKLNLRKMGIHSSSTSSLCE